MKEKAVFLVGGNSEIGNALANGIAKRHGIQKVIKISRFQSVKTTADTWCVDSYKDFSDSILKSEYTPQAIIIAFGILASENNYLEDLQNNFEVNVLQYLRICEIALCYLKENKDTELHVTSSLVADFSRDSIFAYSQSKKVMEESLLFMQRRWKQDALRLFIWKLAYVKTKMNIGRQESIISTTLKSIENAALVKKVPGVYYLPPSAKYPSRILRHFPLIAAKID